MFKDILEKLMAEVEKDAVAAAPDIVHAIVAPLKSWIIRHTTGDGTLSAKPPQSLVMAVMAHAPLASPAALEVRAHVVDNPGAVAV